VKSILFDLDGTLVDTLPGIRYSLAEAIDVVMPNKKVEIPDLRTIIGPPIRAMLRHLVADAEDTALDDLERQFRSTYDGVGWQKCSAYDGVADTLAHIAGHGTRCFVMTNKRIGPTLRILDRLQLRAFFEDVVSWDSGSRPYGSKLEMVQYLTDKHRLDPKTMLLVGDSKDEAQAAKVIGARFAAVTYGYGNVHTQSEWHSDHVLDRFSDLLAIVFRPT
jgi:phosphoglycolate phosphatase